jgi:carbonic anhydrase/acetyltransferase-like protein (isoleucine patch superfamily)
VIRRFQGVSPTLGRDVFVDELALVLGAVTLADDVSIWPFAALRGDVNKMQIGARSNVQDNAVLHVTHDGPYTPGGVELSIGEDVTVGHGPGNSYCCATARASGTWTTASPAGWTWS